MLLKYTDKITSSLTKSRFGLANIFCVGEKKSTQSGSLHKRPHIQALMQAFMQMCFVPVWISTTWCVFLFSYFFIIPHARTTVFSNRLKKLCVFIRSHSHRARYWFYEQVLTTSSTSPLIDESAVWVNNVLSKQQ